MDKMGIIPIKTTELCYGNIDSITVLSIEMNSSLSKEIGDLLFEKITCINKRNHRAGLPAV
ncbi:hypothetical protein L3i20_v218590 [Paenibacillus sp. L3-i20]|nr:hypothetical protein L3i20_v218590 [Paenibacillus sp. L3-i20]